MCMRVCVRVCVCVRVSEMKVPALGVLMLLAVW